MALDSRLVPGTIAASICDERRLLRFVSLYGQGASISQRSSTRFESAQAIALAVHNEARMQEFGLDAIQEAQLPEDRDRDDHAAESGTPGEPLDQWLHGLILLARFHGIAADAAQLRHEAGVGDRDFTETELLLTARRLELKARVVPQPVDRIDCIALPALALCGEGQTFVVARVAGDKVLIQDPADGRQHGRIPRSLPRPVDSRARKH